MRAETVKTGDEHRRPEVEVILHSDSPQFVASVLLRGEHDLATSEAIRVALAPLFGNVLVDLGECDFIDSCVIGVLLRKSRELVREGHRLELLVPADRANVARVLDVIQICELLTVHGCMPEVLIQPDVGASQQPNPKNEGSHCLLTELRREH